jgi:hypothetical protein
VRVLLDESLPRPFVTLLPGHEVRTVAAMGWSGNLEHQQNLTALPISIVVLVAPTNRIESLKPLVPELLELLKALPPRRLVLVGV